MAYAATLHIAADRYTPCVRVLTVKGLDLRSPGLRMQVRLSPDTPGAPLIDLGAVDNPRAEGLALLSVETVDGLVTSVVQIRINESTMKRLPYSGEPGDATTLHYDMIAVVSGDKRVLARGAFTVDAGVTGADAAPSDRPYGYGSSQSAVGIRTGAVLTFGDERVTITVDGADLVAPIARRAEDAANRAEADRSSAAAERQAAEMAADQAEVSRDVAIAARPTFTTQAAGEAATAAGDLFAVAPGDGSAQMRKRTASGSTYLFDFLTNRLRSNRVPNGRLIPIADRLSQSAYITEVVQGRADIDDTDAYEYAMSLPNVREWLYPEGCSIHTTRTVAWLGERTHRFARNARIVGEVTEGANSNGYVVNAQGYPDLIGAGSDAVIPRGAMSFTAVDELPLEAGDDFYTYDVATAEYDVNTVRARIGKTIFTVRPVNYNFLQPTNVRFYALANACTGVRVFGGEIRNVATSDAAHGIIFRNAADIEIDGLSAYETGGIGIYFSVAVRLKIANAVVIRPGRSGLGFRNVMDFLIDKPIVRKPARDEAITFYKNVKNGLVIAPDIEQYLHGEAPSGLGEGGNCILLDERCDDITIRDPRLRMSATYAIFVNNGSNRNRIENPNIQLANLGAIRFAQDSNDNVVVGGWVADVIDAIDTEVGNLPTAALQDDTTCSGNVLGVGTQIARIAGGIAVRQRGERGTVVSRGHSDLRGGILSVSTEDWDDGVSGTRLVARPASPTGDTYLRIYGEQEGGLDFAPVAVSAKSSAPTLTGDGDVVFVVAPNTLLYAAWRDFTGVSRMSAAPLGVQVAAQADSTASTLEGLKADYNAHLANLRSAGLMPPQP